MFGRIEQFDPRSKDYPITRLLKDRHPRSYTWRCNKVLDQGTDGSCVGHAWAHELIARPCEVDWVDHRYAKETLYWTAQKLDPWEGGAYPGASRYMDGSSILAGAKATMTTGLITGYYWAFNLDDLVLGVGRRGPAVIGVKWYEGMLTPDADGWIRPTGRVAGGHAVLVRAVNVGQKRFTIRNSWGPGWGIDGDCFLSFDHMEQLLKDNGEACIALGRRPQPLTQAD